MAYASRPGSLSSDSSAECSAWIAHPVTEVSLSPACFVYRHPLSGFCADTMKSTACCAGPLNRRVADMPYASESARAAIEWLYMYFVPRPPMHPSGSCFDRSHLSPFFTTSPNFRFLPGITGSGYSSLERWEYPAPRKARSESPVTPASYSESPDPSHFLPAHWFEKLLAPHEPSGLWCRASHFNAASTALSVARVPPPRAARFSRPPNRPAYRETLGEIRSTPSGSLESSSH